MVMAIEWMKKERASVPSTLSDGCASEAGASASGARPFATAEAPMKARIKKRQAMPTPLRRASSAIERSEQSGRSSASTSAAATPLGFGESDVHAEARPSPPCSRESTSRSLRDVAR